MTPLLRWLDATEDLRQGLYDEAHDGVLAAIKGKVTAKHRRVAHRTAKGVVLRKLYSLREHGGTPNPTYRYFEKLTENEPAPVAAPDWKTEAARQWAARKRQT